MRDDLITVHPRPRGEHSSYNALIEKVLLDATKRTSLARLSLLDPAETAEVLVLKEN